MTTENASMVSIDIIHIEKQTPNRSVSRLAKLDIETPPSATSPALCEDQPLRNKAQTIDDVWLRSFGWQPDHPLQHRPFVSNETQFYSIG